MREFSAGLFVAQLILVPLLCFIGGGIAAGAVIQATGLSITGYATSAVIGGMFGYRAQRADGRMADSFGQWIWISPLFIDVWFMVGDIRRGHSIACFLRNCNGPSLTGVELYVCTLPAVACCFYALGITLALRNQSRSADRSKNS
jgi:hypothetical protein